MPFMRKFSTYSFPYEPLFSKVGWARSACFKGHVRPCSALSGTASPPPQSRLSFWFGSALGKAVPPRINSHFRTPSHSGSASTSVEFVVYSRAYASRQQILFHCLLQKTTAFWDNHLGLNFLPCTQTYSSYLRLLMNFTLSQTIGPLAETQPLVGIF